MSWQTLHKSSYDTDFLELDKILQRSVINGIRGLEKDPVTPRGNTIKPLKGYDKTTPALRSRRFMRPRD